MAWTATFQPLIGSNSQEYVPKKGFHKWTPNLWHCKICPSAAKPGGHIYAWNRSFAWDHLQCFGVSDLNKQCKIRKGRTWAIAVRRGSYKSLFFLSSDYFALEKREIQFWTLVGVKRSKSLWSKFFPLYKTISALPKRGFLVERSGGAIQLLKLVGFLCKKTEKSSNRKAPQESSSRKPLYGYTLSFYTADWTRASQQAESFRLTLFKRLWDKWQMMHKSKFAALSGMCRAIVLDAAFLLAVGSSLLTVELFYLQWTILAFLLTVGAFSLTVLAYLLTVGAFLLTVGKCV